MENIEKVKEVIRKYIKKDRKMENVFLKKKIIDYLFYEIKLKNQEIADILELDHSSVSYFRLKYKYPYIKDINKIETTYSAMITEIDKLLKNVISKHKFIEFISNNVLTANRSYLRYRYNDSKYVMIKIDDNITLINVQKETIEEINKNSLINFVEQINSDNFVIIENYLIK